MCAGDSSASAPPTPALGALGQPPHGLPQHPMGNAAASKSTLEQHSESTASQPTQEAVPQRVPEPAPAAPDPEPESEPQPNAPVVATPSTATAVPTTATSINITASVPDQRHAQATEADPQADATAGDRDQALNSSAKTVPVIRVQGHMPGASCACRPKTGVLCWGYRGGSCKETCPNCSVQITNSVEMMTDGCRMNGDAYGWYTLLCQSCGLLQKQGWDEA